MFQIKNKVPGTLNKQDWESQTIKDLQKELKKVKHVDFCFRPLCWLPSPVFLV